MCCNIYILLLDTYWTLYRISINYIEHTNHFLNTRIINQILTTPGYDENESQKYSKKDQS